LDSGLKLLELSLDAGEGRPGEILAIDEEGVTVACAEGAVRIKKVQPPSKKAMDAISYLRGRRLGVADLFV
jgi:methionyl-tRNA formyltransferase